MPEWSRAFDTYSFIIKPIKCKNILEHFSSVWLTQVLCRLNPLHIALQFNFIRCHFKTSTIRHHLPFFVIDLSEKLWCFKVLWLENLGCLIQTVLVASKLKSVKKSFVIKLVHSVRTYWPFLGSSISNENVKFYFYDY